MNRSYRAVHKYPADKRNPNVKREPHKIYLSLSRLRRQLSRQREPFAATFQHLPKKQHQPLVEINGWLVLFYFKIILVSPGLRAGRIDAIFLCESS